MENIQRTTMMKSYSNHKGSLPVGERVIVISVSEEKQEVRLVDPFDREWIVPKSYVNLD
jgi:hypothetical protein